MNKVITIFLMLGSLSAFADNRLETFLEDLKKAGCPNNSTINSTQTAIGESSAFLEEAYQDTFHNSNNNSTVKNSTEHSESMLADFRNTLMEYCDDADSASQALLKFMMNNNQLEGIVAEIDNSNAKSSPAQYTIVMKNDTFTFLSFGK